MNARATCSNCGATIVARGPEPSIGRYCMLVECQRARYRAQNRLRGNPTPARACIVCASPIPSDRRRRATCSEACAEERHRQVQRDCKRRLAVSNPLYNIQHHAAVKARAAVDPALAALLQDRQRAAWKRRQERARNDPELRARIRQQARERYALHAAAIQAERRVQLDAMSDEERTAWLDEQRRYQREYASRRRAQRARNPDEHAAYLARLIEYRRQRALARLAATGAELLERMNNATD